MAASPPGQTVEVYLLALCSRKGVYQARETSPSPTWRKLHTVLRTCFRYAPAHCPYNAVPLPGYLPREHDELLSRVVRAAAGGRSGIAVLVGGSSTGKTRACWEALGLLRDQPGP